MTAISSILLQDVGPDGLSPADHLRTLDFQRHNAELPAVWESFRTGRGSRIPVIIGANVRIFIGNPLTNPHSLIDFRRYSEDPDLMYDVLLAFQRWLRFNLLQDAELGIPDQWNIAPNFMNYYEAAWFGCPIEYPPDQVPDTLPAFAANPEAVMENGLPDPCGGLMARVADYEQHFRDRAARREFLGRKVAVSPSLLGTDGVMTVACNLFGAEFVCAAMLDEPLRLQRLFSFITEATIDRISARRKRYGLPLPVPGFGFADDSIALISPAAYAQHVLPHHRRLCQALADSGPRSIHLCGDATRHFPLIRDELNVRCFDTGFPIDFAALRTALGPDVQIQGGPHIELLRTATPAQVRSEVRRILATGVARHGRFALREGNNLAPGTPLENIDALYAAGREFGRLSTTG